MATLAVTPSHGRSPKNLSSKLVKLFPSGLLAYTTEKPQVPGGEMPLFLIMVNLINDSSFPQFPSCLVTVFWYHTGLQKACLRYLMFHELDGSMKPCAIVLDVLSCPQEVPLLLVVDPEQPLSIAFCDILRLSPLFWCWYIITNVIPLLNWRCY